MIDLDELGRQAVALPPTSATSMQVLERRVQKRRHRRRAIIGSAAALVVFGGGALIAALNQTPPVSLDTATEIDESPSNEVAIARLIEGSVSSELPDLGFELPLPDQDQLDLTQVRQYSEVAPELDLYVVPYLDRSGLVFQLFDRRDRGFGISTEFAETFNKRGHVTSQQRADGTMITVFVVPDGVDIGDVGDAVVDSAESLVVIDGGMTENFVVEDGLLTLRE